MESPDRVRNNALTEEERVTRLEKQVRGFRIAIVGGVLEGGFGELKPAKTLEDRISSLEHAKNNFTLVGSGGVIVSGNFKDGYEIQ